MSRLLDWNADPAICTPSAAAVVIIVPILQLVVLTSCLSLFLRCPFPVTLLSPVMANKYGTPAYDGGEAGVSDDFGLDNMSAFQVKSVRLAFIR